MQGLVKRIRLFMREQGYSESSLSRSTNIPQATLHRALKNPVRLTKTHRALCKFAGIDLEMVSGSLEAKEELVQEVLDIWDGSREHALSLVRLLRAAGTLQAYAASQSSRIR